MFASTRRIVTAALLVPLLLFAVAGTSFASWRCQSDGIARASCCCPKQKAAEPAAGPVVSGVGCCQVEQHDFDKAPSDVPRKLAASQLTVAAAFVALPVAAVPDLPAPSLRLAPLALAPEKPGGGRAIVVFKQAFLL
jgi:hypothetical protein